MASERLQALFTLFPDVFPLPIQAVHKAQLEALMADARLDAAGDITDVVDDFVEQLIAVAAGRPAQVADHMPAIMEFAKPFLERLAAREAAADEPKDERTAMELVLEGMLDEASKSMAANDTPAVICQLVITEGPLPQSAVKRGPLPRTYTIGMPAVTQDARGQAVPIAGKLMELTLHGAEIKRIMVLRDGPSIFPAGGRIVSPHS